MDKTPSPDHWTRRPIPARETNLPQLRNDKIEAQQKTINQGMKWIGSFPNAVKDITTFDYGNMPNTARDMKFGPARIREAHEQVKRTGDALRNAKSKQNLGSSSK